MDKLEEYKQLLKKKCGLSNTNINYLHLKKEDIQDLFERVNN